MKKGILYVLVLLVLIFLVYAVPPMAPNSFYGGVTIDGNPAPIESVITATIGNVERGSFTITTEGVYGGYEPSTGLAPGTKLVVEGCVSGESCYSDTQIIIFNIVAPGYGQIYGNNYEIFEEDKLEKKDLQFYETYCCAEFEQRISALESWKEDITQTIATIQTSLSNMLSILTGHTTTIEDHEERITILENKEYPTMNLTHPYFKYLSSTTRRNIVCGYATDSHLGYMEDLGYKCNVTYRVVGARERASCGCEKI